jgi:outer membrane protein OmpA-like peptidoglycan-associated protein
MVELKKLLDFLNTNPNVKVEIGGHTDNTGSKDLNIKLSENRAKSVYNYLIEHEIDMQRLSYKGYADTEPIATNETETGKALNRRTEFKITSIRP